MSSLMNRKSISYSSTLKNDQVSYKAYLFYQAPCFIFDAWTITGAVEEYEADTLFLKSEGGIGKRTKFEDFFANHHQSF